MGCVTSVRQLLLCERVVLCNILRNMKNVRYAQDNAVLTETKEKKDFVVKLRH